MFVRGYDAASEPWYVRLATRRFKNVRGSRGRALRWRVEKPGFETVERATAVQDDALGNGSIDLTLGVVGAQPSEMVSVPGGVRTSKMRQA